MSGKDSIIAQKYREKDVIPARVVFIGVAFLRMFILTRWVHDIHFVWQFLAYTVFEYYVQKIDCPGKFTYSMNIWHDDYITLAIQFVIYYLALTFSFQMDSGNFIFIIMIDAVISSDKTGILSKALRNVLFQACITPYQTFPGAV